MPQLVPNLLTLPETPRFKTAAPAQSSQLSQSDGQSFKDALGRVKDRSVDQPDDSDKQPAKAERKKPARQSKSAGQTGAAAKPQAKTKSKEVTEGQEGQPQPDDSDQEHAQDGQKEPKQQPADTASPSSDASDAAQLAALVQIQSPVAAKPDASSSPKAADAANPQSKVAPTKRAGPRSVTAKPQKVNASADQASKSGDSAAPDSDGDAEAQQSAADQPPQTPGSLPVDNSQATPSKSAKPPLMAVKQNVPAAAPDADSSQQAVATSDLVAQIDATTDDSGDATQIAIDTVAGPKSAAKNSTLDDDASQINPPDASRSKAPGGSFRVAAAPDPAPAPPEAQFAEAIHAKIVSAIHGELLPGGGSMHIRLDPPELGALNVRVEMRDGVMTAAFETTNDQATKLLSHSLGDLKTALEAQGVSVEKLHVRQSSQQHSGDDRRGGNPQDSSAQREQQRRELMRRMWRRLMKGQDPLDLVA